MSNVAQFDTSKCRPSTRQKHEELLQVTREHEQVIRRALAANHRLQAALCKALGRDDSYITWTPPTLHEGGEKGCT